MCDSSGAPSSPRALAESLAQLTSAGGDVDRLILSWKPRTLIEVDAATRSWRFTFDPAPGWFTRLRRQRPTPGELPVLSMTHDGHRREAAVQMLASRPGVASDRLLALRLGDHVPQVRRAAWQALLSRPLEPQLDVVVPILVALRGRAVAASALGDYAHTVEKALGHPLWQKFLDHPDRTTRRWAVTEQITQGMEPTTAFQLLSREQDLLLVRELVEVAIREPEIAQLLATGRTAVGRRRALEVLPACDLSSEQIGTALLDRSAMVRQMAVFRAVDVGIDARTWYRERWESQQDAHALAGLSESGGVLPREDAHALLVSGSSRLQRLGVRFLARLGVGRDDLPLLWGLLDGPAASQVVHTLARSFCWEWSDVANRWQGADERLRRRLWRLLSSRSGWDEVRAHLLAASDPRIAALGRSGLGSWAIHRASRMYRSPTPEQQAHLVALLEEADIPTWQKEQIEFTARKE